MLNILTLNSRIEQEHLEANRVAFAKVQSSGQQ